MYIYRQDTHTTITKYRENSNSGTPAKASLAEGLPSHNLWYVVNRV